MAISLTYTFTAATLAQAAQVNANFSTLATRALDKTGDTMTGSLLFTDATYDIGATGATRPRDFYLSRNAVVGGTFALTGAATLTVPLAIASGGIGAATATANFVFAGPTTGGAAAPSFRALVNADFGSTTNLGAGAYMSTTQAIADNTATVVTYDTEDFDSGTLHSTSSNTGRFTASITAVYHLSATCSFVANGTGFRFVRIRKNGTTSVSGTVSAVGSASATTDLCISASVSMTAADYLEVIVLQTSGGSLNIGHAATRELQSSAQFVRII